MVKLDTSGPHLWSTYLGGSGIEVGYGIAVDPSGNCYATGQTDSTDWVSGGWDTTFEGTSDGYVVKLDASGAHQWSTYLGGSGSEDGRGIAADLSGNCYATGVTASSGWVSGGGDTSLNDNGDGYVVKMDTSGAHQWSSYLGGSGNDYAYGVGVDSSGNCYVTGYTQSLDWVDGGWDTSLGGARDGFVVKISDVPPPVSPSVTSESPVAGSVILTYDIDICVTFSKAVVGVEADDMELSGTAATGSTVGTPTDQGGNTWLFPVSGIVTGTLYVDLAPDADDIEDSEGNDLDPSPTSWSYTVAIDSTPPTADTVSPLTPTPTNSGTVSFAVDFSEDVVHFDGEVDLVITERRHGDPYGCGRVRRTTELYGGRDRCNGGRRHDARRERDFRCR